MYSNQISLGMRFRMMCETEELGTRRYVKLPIQTLTSEAPSCADIFNTFHLHGYDNWNKWSRSSEMEKLPVAQLTGWISNTILIAALALCYSFSICLSDSLIWFSLIGWVGRVGCRRKKEQSFNLGDWTSRCSIFHMSASVFWCKASQTTR